MSRTKKQASPDLKALEHIPAVREALHYVGLDLIVRPLQSAPSAARPAPQMAPAPSHDARAAWVEQSAEVEAALAAEMPKSEARPPKPPSALPAGQRRAIEMGLLQDIGGIRREKLAQFRRAPPGAPETEPVVDTVELTTLSEAT